MFHEETSAAQVDAPLPPPAFRTRAGRCTVSALLMAMILPRAVVGQAITLDERPVCATCDLQYTIVDTLGAIDDPASPAVMANAVRLTDGRVYVTSSSFGGQVMVYNGGEFSFAFGRQGEGPGEFGSAALLRVWPGDTIAALDLTLFRVSLFTSAGAFARSFALDVRPSTFGVRPSGGFIITGPRPVGDTYADVQLVSSTGDVEAYLHEVPQDEWSIAQVPQVALSPTGGIWLMQTVGGRLERWSPDAERELIVDIPTAYFDWSFLEEGGSPVIRGVTNQVGDLHVDSEGRVWIFLLVGDPDFTPADLVGGGSLTSIYDTRIMVLAPGGDRVLASRDFDGTMKSLGEGWGFDLVDTPDGDRRIEIGTLRLVER